MLKSLAESVVVSQDEVNNKEAFRIENDCTLESVGNFTSNDCSGMHSAADSIQVESSVTNVLNQVSRRLSLECKSKCNEALRGEFPTKSDLPNEHKVRKSPPYKSSLADRNLNSSVRSLHSASKRTGSLLHTNSVPKDLSLCHIPSKSLIPVTPKSLPPPLEKNFSSMQLRTSYHCESDTEIKKTHKQNCIQNTSTNLSTDTISAFSSFSTSVLPPISAKDARKRSFLVGNVRGKGSLLGIDELSRYFPDNKVKIFVGTWNMNCQNSPNNIDDFLLPDDMVYVPDIYAIGAQEGMQDRKEWEILIQTSLGPSHVLFHSAYLGVLYLAIFLRRDLIWFCSAPEDSYVSTRTGSMVKTKGAVAITFIFFGTTFLFINSHLTDDAL